MTKEEILNKHDSSRKYIEQTCRPELFSAMEEFARQKALDFDTWKQENRWFSFENGYWYHTFEQGTRVSDATYNKHYRKTPDELYSQFIENQTK